MDELYTMCQKLWEQLEIERIGWADGEQTGKGVIYEGHVKDGEWKDEIVLTFYQFVNDDSFDYFILHSALGVNTVVAKQPARYPSQEMSDRARSEACRAIQDYLYIQ